MLKYILPLIIALSANASMLPPNNLRISKDVKANINKAQFEKLINKTIKPYEEIFSLYGATDLDVQMDWENETVNAASGKRDNVFLLKIYGGLARHPLITEDAFTMILCHEIGHLIGGAPTWKPFNQASSEGQADYFAANKCFKKINLNEDIEINDNLLPQIALKKCQETYSNSKDFNLCKRSILAQKSLIALMAELSNTAIPEYETPDSYVRMFIIFNGYPSTQCRLDTLFAGSLCQSDINELHDMELYNKGNCSVQGGDTIGLRPKCWYVERDDV